MGSFVAWVAKRYEPLQQWLRTRAQELRPSYQTAVHRRLPSALAELQASFELFLEFAVEVGAVAGGERQLLQARCIAALNDLLGRQAKYHEAADPARQFLGLVRTALASGRAHVSDRQGKPPENAAAWGWHSTSTGRWLAQSPKIGWVVGPNLYLEPAVSYEVAQLVAGGERLPASEQKLRQSLRERNLLASVDTARKMLLVRRTLEGRPRKVLHLWIRDL